MRHSPARGPKCEGCPHPSLGVDASVHLRKASPWCAAAMARSRSPGQVKDGPAWPNRGGGFMSVVTRFAPFFVALASVGMPATCNALDWPTKCAQRAYACASVEVSEADAVTVAPEPIDVGPRHTITKLVWALPQGFAFVRSHGDGIFVKNHNGEFDRETVVDDDETPTTQPRKRFRVRARKPFVVDRGYEYAVIFHQLRAGQPVKRFQCDPTIINSDGLRAGRPTVVRLTRSPLRCVVQ